MHFDWILTAPYIDVRRWYEMSSVYWDSIEASLIVFLMTFVGFFDNRPDPHATVAGRNGISERRNSAQFVQNVYIFIQ